MPTVKEHHPSMVSSRARSKLRPIRDRSWHDANSAVRNLDADDDAEGAMEDAADDDG